MTQIAKRSRFDWVHQTLRDLQDFEIDQSLSYLQSVSEGNFKKVVKSKSKEYALRKYKLKQDQHQKMRNLNYNELNIQNYLVSPDISIESKKTIYQWRILMARFGVNFRGGKSSSLCPLCHLHEDSQIENFNCEIIKKRIVIEDKYDHIFEEIQCYPNHIKTITKISQIRKQILNQD